METLIQEPTGSGLILNPQSQKEIIEALGTKGPDLHLGCMDYNYCLKQRHPLRECKVEMFDMVAYAGCVNTLSVPHSVPNRTFEDIAELYFASRVVVKHSIRLAMDAHKVTKVLMSTHRNCGHVAWEGHRFKNQVTEERKHRKDRKEAARWLHSLFPELEIWTCFNYLDANKLVQIKSLQLVKF